MQLYFLLMLAIGAIGTALPPNNSSVDIEVEDSSTITTAKPESKVIQIESSHDLKTNISRAGGKLVIMYFSASWCPSSKRIAAAVKDIAETMDNVVVLEVDVDKNYNIANEYEVGAMPTFVFMKNSKKLKKQLGADVERLWNNTRLFM